MKGDVLTPRQRAVLRALDDDEWKKASDIGATTGSHHSQTLRALVLRGLAGVVAVHGPGCRLATFPGEVMLSSCESCRGYRTYRRTASGKRALAELATSRDVRE